MPTVDTLKAYEALTAADMPDRQARALVTIVQELQETRLAEVAGKADIGALKTELKEDIGSLRAEMKEDIASLRAELKEDIVSLRAELKEDIVSLRAELKEDIVSLRAEMKALEARHEIKFTALEAKIDRVKFDLLKWFIPLILGQAAFVVTLLKLLK
ncbi:coiled-coil domain-containing protein [Desulfobacca acetoxidans]